MGRDESVSHDAGDRIEDEWIEPFRKALGLHGRPADKHKWHIIWVRKLAVWMRGKPLRQLTREDAEGFLATLSTSPGIADWQLDQAADSLRILIGSVFGQDWAHSIHAPAPPPSDIPVPVGDDPIEKLKYTIRCRNYSALTEKSYSFWVERFLVFCKEAQVEPGTDAVRAFLERLVISANMSASTQSQALNALVFHFKHVLGTPFSDLGDLTGAGATGERWETPNTPKGEERLAKRLGEFGAIRCACGSLMKIC